MSTNRIFKLSNGFIIREVHPIYKDDLSLDYSLESGERYYRADLGGKIRFVGADFDWVSAQPLDTEFTLELGHIVSNVFISEFKGKFTKLDADWDLDNSFVSLKVETKDQYTKVLKGIDKEYDLIKLAPAKLEATIKKRPLIQLYVPGANVVSCFVGGMYWEQEVVQAIDDEGDLASIYKFAIAEDIDRVTITGTGTPDFGGDYDSSDGGFTYTDGANTIIATRTSTVVPYGGVYLTVQYSIFIGSTEYYASDEYDGPIATGKYYDGPIAFVKVEPSASGSFEGFSNDLKVYGRYMTDTGTVLGVDTYDIPDEDILADNRNYERCVGYAFEAIILSRETQTDPTEYGKSDSGEYFEELVLPPSSGLGKCYPVGRSNWGYVSMWFSYPSSNTALEDSGTRTYGLKDAIFLSDVIKVLINEIDPTLTHEATTEYSRFLYDSINPISFNSFKLALTQKSNILAGEYDRPAQKAPITLQDVLRMLKDTFKCYWYIDENKFKIEHISYFKKGKSYGGELVSLDLATLIDSRNRKSWGFATNKYSFLKSEIPERYEFKWMDDVTKGFEGFPIEVESPLVQDGKIEQINISNFTSDIDYMLLNPQSINQDGFALLGLGPDNSLPLIDWELSDREDVRLQNGYCSLLYTHKYFWNWDLPNGDVRINGADSPSVVLGTIRSRKQKIKFPSISPIDPYGLIKTELGNGQIQKLSVNLSSGINQIELQYDAE